MCTLAFGADTLLQPKMKKKRSVTSLEKKDLKSSNKYVLTQQTQDSDGGLSSQLVKVSDVTTTCSNRFDAALSCLRY